MLLNRERLAPDDLHRYDDQIRHVGGTLDESAKAKEALAMLPVNMPDAIPKRAWKKKNDAKNARALTASELSVLATRNTTKRQEAGSKRSSNFAHTFRTTTAARTTAINAATAVQVAYVYVAGASTRKGAIGMCPFWEIYTY
jgi:hypothetical protein